MNRFVRTKVFSPRSITLVVMLLVVLVLGIFAPALARPAARSAAMVEEKAGTWKTWVLSSGDQVKADAPPDDAATKKEIDQLKDMVAKRDDTTLTQIAYWNSGPPSYRWNQIGTDYVRAGFQG